MRQLELDMQAFAGGIEDQRATMRVGDLGAFCPRWRTRPDQSWPAYGITLGRECCATMRAAQQSGNLVNSERPAKETWPADTLEFNRPEKGSLFQRGADRGEIGAELSADALNGDDDRDGDAGGDQTVFNGGCAPIFCHQSLLKTLQTYPPQNL